MTTTAREDLIALLCRAEWGIVGRGPIGELWKSPRGDEVGIPYRVDPSAFEWSGVVSRVAAAERIALGDLNDRISWFRFDVTEFRVDGPEWDHSVPVDAGFNLFKTARALLRSCATTSQSPKAVIGSNYSAPGERVLADARFAQTREGSYVVPLMVPVATGLAVGAEGQPVLEGPAGDQVLRSDVVEPDARRATRTMAMALDSVWTQIVAPDRVPRAETLNELVLTAGVSREMISSLSDVLKFKTVKEFDAEFHWSEHEALTPPRLTSRVAIPSEAAEILGEVTKRLKPTKEPKVESLTGRMVELRHDVSEIGSLTISTVRNSRQAEVVIPLTGETLTKAHTWFSDGEVLLARGEVRRISNRLRMDRPRSLGPLGQSAFKV